jgi:hypothetical protein
MTHYAESLRYAKSLLRVIRIELDKHYPDEGYLIEKIDKLKDVSLHIARAKRSNLSKNKFGDVFG